MHFTVSFSRLRRPDRPAPDPLTVPGGDISNVAPAVARYIADLPVRGRVTAHVEHHTGWGWLELNGERIGTFQAMA